jgi:hypothetical protein
MHIGIITVQDPAYHPNRRLLDAAHAAGHPCVLIHPYRLWPKIAAGRLEITGTHSSPLPHVVLPRQGAQIGDACLALIHQFQLMGVTAGQRYNAVFIARNKFLTQQVLTAAGLPCPDTVFVNDDRAFFMPSINWAATRWCPSRSASVRVTGYCGSWTPTMPVNVPCPHWIGTGD